MYSGIRRHGQVSRQNKNRMKKEILNINKEKETVKKLNMNM
jgi:hypothetical protein